MNDKRPLHSVIITVSDPTDPAVSKRKELIQRKIKVRADDKAQAIDTAIRYYKKRGYKVHDDHYNGIVEEAIAKLTFKQFLVDM